MKTNIILKAAVLIVILAVVFVVIKMKKTEQQTDYNEFSGLSAVESGPAGKNNGLSEGNLDNLMLEKELGVDTDSPLETMKTLTNETRAVRQDSEKLQDVLKEQKVKTEALLKMEEIIKKRMDNKFEKQEREFDDIVKKAQQERKVDQGALAELRSQLDAALSDIGTKKSKWKRNLYPIGDDIPSGLGFDEETGAAIDYDEVVWIDPVDATKSIENPGGLSLPDFTKNILSGTRNIMPGTINQEKTDKEERSIRAYTIPINSTLLGSTAMTAMVGRIPVDGKLEKPYPFKILIGPENLSSNDIRIPGIEGIKMSGIASGDWALSCASGNVYSMTFTFQDGTIVTYPEPGETMDKPIAWISDKNGHPCITGKRVTNALSYLGGRIALSAAEAYAEAQVANQFVTQVSSDGNITRVLDGSANTAASNRAIAEGLSETSDWVDKRQANSFDVIYVPPGTEMSVHMLDQINIDYDPEGRKVNHYANLNSFSTSNLD